MTPSSSPPLEDIREYYRTVGPFLDLEQAKRKDGDFWRAIVREHDRPLVLELGAGNGRATRYLAPSAAGVIGLDVVPEFLAAARDRLRGENVLLVLADMRAVPARGPFDLVVAANDPFVHVAKADDREGVLRWIADNLRPNGRFILDAHWLAPEARREAESSGGRARERTLGDPSDGLSVRESWRCERGSMRCTARYEYLRGGRLVGEATLEGVLWSPAEVSERFARAGLTVRAIWGSYERDPFDPGSSRRLVVEAVPGAGWHRRSGLAPADRPVLRPPRVSNREGRPGDAHRAGPVPPV